MVRPLVFGITMALALPAQAQQNAGEPRNQALVTSLYQAGQCMVARDRAGAVALFRALPAQGEAQSSDLARAVAATGCLDRPLPGNSAPILRGAIAQALQAQDFPQFAAPPIVRGRLVDLQLPIAASDGDRTYRWADCVVRNDLRNTELLLGTAPGSAQETQVLIAMQPYMRACAEGADPGVPDVFLRSLFAQTSYSVFYRYWNGALRATTGSPDNPVECRTYEETGSRVQAQRYCLPRSDWVRVDESLARGANQYLRRLLDRR